MALQVRVAPSKVVLQNLLICVILFYTVYYVVLSVGCMALQVYELSVLAPFDFKICPSWLNTSYQVLLISTEVTYFICGLLFVLIVEEWVWDYAISVTILHVAITSTVMLEFPLASHWWAALVLTHSKIFPALRSSVSDNPETMTTFSGGQHVSRKRGTECFPEDGKVSLQPAHAQDNGFCHVSTESCVNREKTFEGDHLQAWKRALATI